MWNNIHRNQLGLAVPKLSKISQVKSARHYNLNFAHNIFIIILLAFGCLVGCMGSLHLYGALVFVGVESLKIKN